MSMTEESKVVQSHSIPEIMLATPTDRRTDIDEKQLVVSELLREYGCDGLLVLRPENFSWLTSGAIARGVLDEEAMPGLFFSQDGRWLLASNVDTQRLFDEEIDGLGFQLKEWPWDWGRAQLLADLCQGRTVACDVPLENTKWIADPLQRLRRTLSEYEIACYRALGQILSHALEATGRTLARGETEREIAGQCAHRLIHRGAHPVQITIAADGRSRRYRQSSFTSQTVSDYCVLTATAVKYGLYARASRAVSFGEADPQFRKEHDSACKVAATYVASSWPDALPRQILMSGQRIYQITGFENEFYQAPQGFLLGHAAVEKNFLPRDEELLQTNWAVCWNTSVGAALSCDTFLISEDGPRAITAAENWPLKRIRIQGSEFVRPDVLVRD